MLDWIFEGIVTWVSSIAADLMDAVSGIFLQALGTDMSAMEGYFPFVTCKCQRKSEPGAHEKVSHKRPRKSEPERSRIVDPVC